MTGQPYAIAYDEDADRFRRMIRADWPDAGTVAVVREASPRGTREM